MDFDSLARQPAVEWRGDAPHQELQRGERALEPAEDPFYRPPSGFAEAAPGTVLRSRDVELAFLGLIPQRTRATQLLYRTADHNGSPQTTVTTVLAPAERHRAQPCPIVSYQCAIDAVSGRCFPSYALRRHARASGSFAQFELMMIAAVLAQGWAVSVPDHEGPNGCWGAPYEPGYCVLDGVRAALGFERLGLSDSTPIGLWGYSGGGLATGWAAEVCADYAPELEIAGIALGSPVADLGHTLLRLNGTFWSGLPAVMIASLAHVYPGLERVIEEHATARGRELLSSLESMTTAGAVMRMRHRDLDDGYIDAPLDKLVATPAVQHVFEDTRLGSHTPKPPLLMVQAIHDQVISVDDIDTLATTYRAGGARVNYHRDLLSDHVLLHPLSAPMVLAWLRDRFAGRPLTEPAGSSLPTVLNPATYLGLLRLGRVAVEVLTGTVLRRRPW